MRNLLALLGLLVVVFLGVGYVRGWYDFSSRAGGPGQTSIQIDVNTRKIGDDVERGGKAVGEKIHDLIDKGTDRLQGGVRPK